MIEKIKKGRVYIILHPGDQFYEMGRSAGNGVGRYLAKARWVMAKHLKRPLRKSEIVHHKNGIKMDDRLRNLKVMTKKHHDRLEGLKKKIRLFERILARDRIRLRRLE
jgi:hypothetical protein